MRNVGSIHIKQCQVAEPPFVIIVAVGDYKAIDMLEAMTAYLLEKRGAAIQQIACPPYVQLIPDTLSHS